GCFTFAVSAGQVSAIKFSFDGTEYRSSLDRNANELALLARYGSEIQGMTLQSYLFFGSANRLYQQVKSLLETRPECRFLVFARHLVTGMDSSAAHSFSQIKDVADKFGTSLVLVNFAPALERSFIAAGLISVETIVAPNLDLALEACEQAVI